MANYFTQHHFSPRWSTPAHHDAPAEHLTPKSTNTQTPPHHHPNNGHHRHPSHMHDTVSRFLQALNLHYGPDDYDVIHPHFDMVETKTSYAVYGELPGLGREDITVEANDHLFTLTIAGELKRTAPQEATETTAATIADTEGVGISHLKAKEPEPEPEPDASNTSKAAPPTKEPEAEAEAGPKQAKPSTETEATSSTAKPAENNNSTKPEHKNKDTKKEDELYWHVKERRVGHFKRVFRFPVELVEMANIKANLHHGLICVIVPKRDDLEAYNKKVEEARKVDIFQGGPDQTYPLFGYFF